MLVAEATLAALGDGEVHTGGAEVHNQFPGCFVERQRAGRDADDEVLAGEAELLLAAPGLAALGVPVVLAAEVEEGVDVLVGDEDDIAAAPSVAAVGAALGDVF